MAGSSVVGQLRALITADTSAFDVAMASSSAKTKAWSADFTQLGLTSEQVGSAMVTSMTRSLASVDALAKGFSGAGIAKAADEWYAAINRLPNGALSLTAKEQEKVNALVTEAIEKYQALGQTAPAHLIALRDATKQVEDNTVSLTARVKELGSQSLAAGTALTAGLTVPLAGMATISVKAAMDFETAFAGVRKTVTGTPAELDAINVQFREMAKVTPVSAVGLSKIGESAGQLGVSKENLVGFTKTIVDISVATHLTTDEASTDFAKLANVMKMPQAEFANLGSAVVALGNFGASTEQEMLNMGQRIAAAGSTAGMSAAQVLGIANALSSVGIEAEAGGTAISRVINKMSMDVASGGGHLAVFAKVSGESAAEFSRAWREDAGMAFAKFMQGLADARTRGGDELIGLIHELGFDANVRLANSFMAAANAGNLMMDSIKLGTKAFTENTELTRASAERYKTTANQLEILKNNLTDVAIEMGNNLLPIINDTVKASLPLVHTIEDAVKWFGSLPEPVKLTALALGGTVAAIGPLLLALGGLARGLTAVMELYATLTVESVAADAALATTAGSVDVLNASLVTLELNPIVLALVALGSAALIMKHELDQGTLGLREHAIAVKDADTIHRAFQATVPLTADQQKELKAAVDRSSDAINGAGAAASTYTSGVGDLHIALDGATVAAGKHAAALKVVTADQELAALKASLAATALSTLSTQAREGAIAIFAHGGNVEEATKQLTAHHLATEGDRDALNLLHKEFTAGQAAIQKHAAALAAANTKSAEDTSRLEDDTKARTLKASQQTLEGKLADIETWFQAEHNKLMHSAEDSDHYYAHLDALRANRDAKDDEARNADDAKRAAANKKSADETTKLEDDTAARTLKASHQTLEGKLADIQTWYDNEFDKLLHSGEDFDHYYAHLDALRANRTAREDQAREAEAEANRKAGEKSVEAHDKTLDAIQASEEKSQGVTLALWEKYDSLVLKAHGDSLQSQLEASRAAGDRQQALLLNNLAKELSAIEHNDHLFVVEKQFASMQAILIATQQAVAIGKITQAEADAITKAFDLKAVKAAFQDLEAVAGSSFGGVLKSLEGGIESLMQETKGPLQQGIETLTSDGTKSAGQIATAWVQVGASIASAVVQIANFTKGQETMTKGAIVASDTEKGAQIGTQIMPGWGTLIGAGIGALVGALTTPQWEKAEKDVGNEMGVHISEGVALGLTQIEVNVKKMDQTLSDNAARHYAELLSLDKIIADQGGLTSANLDKWALQAGRLFEVIHHGGELGAAGVKELSTLIGQMAAVGTNGTGQWTQSFASLLDLTLQMPGGVEVINQNWDALVKSGTDGSGIWSAGLLNLIARAKELGTNLQGVEAMIAGQQDALGKGLAGVTGKSGADAKTMTDLQKTVTDAQAAYDDLVKSGAAQEKITQAADKLKQAQTAVAHAAATSQVEFDRLGRIALNSFNTLVASGKSPIEAMQAVGGSIDDLIADAKAFGLSGNDAFAQLSRWRTLTQVNAPLLTEIGDLNSLMVATANLGGLTADSFGDMEKQGLGAYNQLIAAGFTQQEAELAEKPLLESIIKLHKEKGLAIDDDTQKLIDQATADGVITGEQITTNDILLGIAQELSKAFGVDLPDNLKTFADKGKEAADKVKGKDGLEGVGGALTGDGGLSGDLDQSKHEWNDWGGHVVDTAKLAVDGVQDAFKDVFVTVPVHFTYESTPSAPSPPPSSGGSSDESAAWSPAAARLAASMAAAAMPVAMVYPPSLSAHGFGADAAALAGLRPTAIAAAPLASTTIVLEADGRSFARVVVPHIPTEVKRMGLTRI